MVGCGVVWVGLDVGEMVAGAICGVLGVYGLVVGDVWVVVVADAQVSNADWGVLFMGRLVMVALVGDFVWGVLGFDGLVAGVLGGELGVGSQVTVAVWGRVGGDWLVLFSDCVGWV